MTKLGMKKNTVKNEVKARTRPHSKVAGGREYDITDPITRLIFTCGTMFGEPTFYEDRSEYDHDLGVNESAQELIATMQECVETAPEDFFVVMSWCRDQLRMRTTPEVGFAIASADERAKHLLPVYEENLLTRADQIRTAFAAIRHLYYRHTPKSGEHVHKGTINKPTARALAQAFKRFDEYQFLKWDGSPVSFKDVWNMIAQKVSEKDRISKPIRYFLTKGEILDADATPVFAARQAFNKETDLKKALSLSKDARVTWEVLLSKFGGGDEEVKRTLWEHLIDTKSLPYMATLRNLRNIEQADVSEKHLDKVYTMLTETPADEHKQLPFRFYAARMHVKNQELESAIDIALDKSVENLPKLTGNSLVLTDLSGSMSQQVSGKSEIRCVEAGTLLASIFAKAQGRKTTVGAFACDFEVVNFSEADSTMSIMKAINDCYVGGSTHAHLGVEWALKNNKKFDRIVLLSDMCCYKDRYWGSDLPTRFAEYQRKYPDTFLYSINLAGNTSGSQMAPDSDKVCLLSGYSENLFKLFASFEAGTEDEVTGKEKQLPTIDELRNKYSKHMFD